MSNFHQSTYPLGMKEAESKVITIEDADHVTFTELLKFIYCGEFPENLDGSPEIYLPLAEKYDLQDLKDGCSRIMASNLSRGNVVNCLILADLYRCPDLKKECFRCLKEWKSTLEDDALKPLQEYPVLLMELYRST